MDSFKGLLEERGEGLPERPKCFPGVGRISCECAGTMKRYECAERRAFWIHAMTIAEMPDDATRRAYMLGIKQADRRQLGRAALILLSEHS